MIFIAEIKLHKKVNLFFTFDYYIYYFNAAVKYAYCTLN